MSTSPYYRAHPANRQLPPALLPTVTLDVKSVPEGAKSGRYKPIAPAIALMPGEKPRLEGPSSPLAQSIVHADAIRTVEGIIATRTGHGGHGTERVQRTRRAIMTA